MAGDVSRSQDFYNVIQYDDILNDTAQAIRRKQKDYDLEIEQGEVDISDNYHKMRAETILGGDTDITVGDDDRIKTGLLVRSGHSGFHGLKVEPSALREICSNGMKGWVADQTYEQTHSEPYQPELVQHGVDAVVEGSDHLEDRLQKAKEEKLVGGKQEVRLLMHDLGIDQYLDTPVADIPLSIEDETPDDEVSLYDAYQAATRALTHHSRGDINDHKLDRAFDEASKLLETGYNELPDAEQLGEKTVEKRLDQLTRSSGTDRYWEGEDEDVRELAELHGLTA